MKIFFVRHGEYQNPEGLVPFHAPGFPLSELGRQQTQEIANRLATEKIRTLSTSPVERCVETATIISKTIHLYPNIYEDITETKSPTGGQKKSPKFDYIYDDLEHISGGGETTEEIYERMNNFVNKFKQLSKNSNHVIVSHGDPIDIFLIKTLKGKIPHNHMELKHSGVRCIPMGGLVMLDYDKNNLPKYQEII